MKIWTVDEMLAEGPCGYGGSDDGVHYCRARLKRLWAGRERLSIRDVLELDIPDCDKVWAACRDDALDPKTLKMWIDGMVTRAVTNHALHCGIEAIERWAANWLNGTDRSEAAAAEAAEAAEWARATVGALVTAGAMKAWWKMAAAEAAARAAEYHQQVEDLRELLSKS